MTTDNGGQGQQREWRWATRNGHVELYVVATDTVIDMGDASISGMVKIAHMLNAMEGDIRVERDRADHAQAAQAQRWREALERIANADWRIISGSIGPLMNVGYSMAGEQASKMARDALAPSAGQEEGTNA